MKFYTGLHQPSDAGRFSHCMVSVNRLRKRVSGFAVQNWLMDSGAFTELIKHGAYRHGVESYAEQVNRWSQTGNLDAAIAQDYMCDDLALERTGLTRQDHQRLTIERYDSLLMLVERAYVMPVLQGFSPASYVQHVRDYGERLKPGHWVGVGSVCRRNRDPEAIASVLLAILSERPDLRLHGFGIKFVSLADATIRPLLHSADSMAWSYSARKKGRSGNDWREAECYTQRINGLLGQYEQPRLILA